MRTVFVASLGLLALVAACSSSSGGGDHIVTGDASDDPAADRATTPDAGDAPGDLAGSDHVADAGTDEVAVDAVAADALASDASLDGGPATPVAVQVPIGSAPIVAGWHANCVVSDSDVTGTNTCWVIQWRQWTYWALGNTDNRQAFLIVGVDAAGNLKSAGVERMGGRYLWLASVDATAMTVTYAGQAGGAVTISWADLDEELPPSPEASEAAIELAPTVAGGWYASCVYTTSDFTLTNTCPVVKWGQWTYWALSNVSNDNSLYIVGVDAHGAVNPAGGLTKNNTRYVWKVTVDSGARTATFYGQASQNVDVTFDELRQDQP